MLLNQISYCFSTKQKYILEPAIGTDLWVFRKEGSNCILKRAKHKLLLMYLVENLLNNEGAELRVCDNNGMVEEIIDFEKMKKVK